LTERKILLEQKFTATTSKTEYQTLTENLINIAAYLLRAITVEQEKKPLLGNALSQQ
jgi:hypothetical protein